MKNLQDFGLSVVYYEDLSFKSYYYDLQKYNELVKYANKFEESTFKAEDSIVTYEFNGPMVLEGIQELEDAGLDYNDYFEIVGVYSDMYLSLLLMKNLTSNSEYLEWYYYNHIYNSFKFLATIEEEDLENVTIQFEMYV